MRGKWQIGLLCCVTVLLSGGCSSEQSQTLRIGISLWPGYEPFFLARDLGFYDDLPVTIIEYPSPSGASRAMKNGTIDAVALTLDEVLLLINSGVEGQVVLVTDISDGGDVILARPNIANIQQLRGKTIASESTVLASYLLNRALTLHGFELDDVNRVYHPMSEHSRLYSSGQIDAVITYEPAKTHLINAGAGEIFSSADIPDEIVDVLMVRQSFINHQPELLRSVIDGWYQALTFFDNSPKQASQMISRRLQITPQEVMESYQGLHLPRRAEVSLMLGEEGTLYPSAKLLQQTMHDHQLLHGTADDLRLVFTNHLLQ